MLLPLFIIIPLISVILISVFRKMSNRFLDSIVVLSTMLLVALCAITLPEIISHGSVKFQIGNWPVPLSNRLIMDGLSIVIALTVNFLAFLIAVYSVRFLDTYKDRWKYYCLYMLIMVGLNGVLLSTDLFNLFVFSEIALISGYILAAFNGEGENFEASFRYAVLGTISSLLILLAIAFIYAKVSSLFFPDIALYWHKTNSVYDIFVVLLLIVGIGLKSAMVPFHTWVPDAYSSAPSPISALYSGAMIKVLGIYVLIRLFYNVIGTDPISLTVLSTLGVISIIVGVVLALYQWDFKRLLSYHSISQIGMML